MRFGLEMARILLILLLGLTLLSIPERAIIGLFRQELTFKTDLALFGANYLVLLVWYRNRLQFTGWFRKGSQRLSARLTRILLGVSLVLFGAAFFV